MSTNIGDLINTTGSAATVSGSTPFGQFDAESSFISDAQKVAVWTARKLGAPIVQVELTWQNVYACFEESISEYSTKVNNSNMVNWLLNYYGNPTGSTDYTHKFPVNTFGFMKRYAQSVDTEAGVGGLYDWKSGSVDVTSNKQYYDLQALWGAVSESNERLEVKEVWHYSPSAIQKFYTPYAGSVENWTDSFGTLGTNIEGGVAYRMMPVYYDLLRAQAIELSDMVRKSNYSWEVINNKLRITPVPSTAFKLFFRYVVNSDPLNTDDSSVTDTVHGVADQANVPYEFMEYNTINSMGKQWIRRYTLALSKELLGHVRSKFQSLPIPNGEVTLNGETLMTQAQEEKTQLFEELKELLEKTDNQALMESEAETQTHLQSQMNKIPLLPYIGCFFMFIVLTGLL